MPKVIFVAVVLLIGMGQVFSSCDQREGGPAVIGWVEAKRLDHADGTYMITINNTEYEVPVGFWKDVKTGDLVKWDGRVWTVVRRGSG